MWTCWYGHPCSISLDQIIKLLIDFSQKLTWYTLLYIYTTVLIYSFIPTTMVGYTWYSKIVDEQTRSELSRAWMFSAFSPDERQAGFDLIDPVSCGMPKDFASEYSRCKKNSFVNYIFKEWGWDLDAGVMWSRSYYSRYNLNNIFRFLWRFHSPIQEAHRHLRWKRGIYPIRCFRIKAMNLSNSLLNVLIPTDDELNLNFLVEISWRER